MMIAASLPDTVQSLTMFEDFNEDHNTVVYSHRRSPKWFGRRELVRTPDAFVGSILAQRSQRLQTLSASYMVDARDFFRAAVYPECVWGHLNVLTLTSRYLNRSSDVTIVNEMLQNAGRAALNMPALARLTIWNGTKGNACEFRYEAAGVQAFIEWHSNWPLLLTTDVVSAWERAAERHTGARLLVREPRNVQKKYIGSHATAIEILGLQDRVLHPVSFRQIACETSRYWFKYYSVVNPEVKKGCVWLSRKPSGNGLKRHSLT